MTLTSGALAKVSRWLNGADMPTCRLSGTSRLGAPRRGVAPMPAEVSGPQRARDRGARRGRSRRRPTARGAVADDEEHLEDADEQSNSEDHLQTEHPEQEGDRNNRQQERANEIRRDEDRPTGP